MRINIRFAGAGGQGVILSSVLLAKAYGLGEDYNISQTQSYGPEARGGACKAEVVISDEEIDYMKVDEADVFIAFNQVGYDKYVSTVKKDAIVLVNSTLVEPENEGMKKNPNFYEIPATEIAEDMGKPLAVNMVMLGALTKLLPKLHYPTMKSEIMANFAASIAGSNIEAYDKGYQYIADEKTQREMSYKKSA